MDSNRYNPQNIKREDVAIAGMAIFRGFDVTCKKYGDAFSFTKGWWHCWGVYDGWRTAYLDGNKQFTLHQTHPTLAKALERIDMEHELARVSSAGTIEQIQQQDL